MGDGKTFIQKFTSTDSNRIILLVLVRQERKRFKFSESGISLPVGSSGTGTLEVVPGTALELTLADLEPELVEEPRQTSS